MIRRLGILIVGGGWYVDQTAITRDSSLREPREKGTPTWTDAEGATDHSTWQTYLCPRAREGRWSWRWAGHDLARGHPLGRGRPDEVPQAFRDQFHPNLE